MKKALWFAVLGFIIAQSIPAETCDVTLDDNRETTVTQFCLSSLEKRFSTKGKLNFTLNGSVLLFTPLPENRQVEIKIHDDSDGLEAWANLANAFVDSIASESLPYEDVILPYLESSVDSPIASQCGTNNTSGTGDVSVGDLLNNFRNWWAPLILVTVLGPVFAIIFIIAGTCFCCCRLCGKCSGKHQKNNDICCFVSYVMVCCCICLLFIGVVFAFHSNEKVNDSIRDFDGIVNTAIDNLLGFVEDTQREVNITVDRYDEVSAFLECEINNTHISIGSVVIETFEPLVQSLIDSSLVLATQLNASIDALIQVNTTVVQLKMLTEILQMELDSITNQTTELMTMCSETTGVLSTVCDMIPNISYAVVVDYSDDSILRMQNKSPSYGVDDVSIVLTALQQVGDIKSQALQTNDSFYAIPCDIRDQVANQTREILDEASYFQQIIANITADVERDLNDILDEDGFIGNVRTQSRDIQESIDEYDTPRYVISILLCSLTLVVIVVLIVGLYLGANGFRKVIKHERDKISKCGGITLLVAVGLMFGFAVILLFLSSITFFIGANMLKVCYSIAEDPPNDLPSYELYTRVVDNSELWGGYLLGCFLLENSSVPLAVTDVLNGCRDNGALYQVAQLAERPSLNLEDVTNISSQIPNLDGLFEDLEDDVQFNRDQILTEDTTRSLEDYVDAGLQEINYTSYIVQTRSIISTLNVSKLIEMLEGVRNEFDASNQSALASDTDAVIDMVQTVNDTTITAIVSLTDVLEAQILVLNDTASQLDANVDDVIRRANDTFDELQNSSIVINQTRAVLDNVIAYADSYAKWAIDNLEDQIGRCRPLYATYSNVYFDVCEGAVDGINGFWLAIGWCVLFFIPTIVFTVRLSDNIRRTREEWDFDIPLRFKLGYLETYELKENPEIAPKLKNWPANWDEQPTEANGIVKECHVAIVSPNSNEYKKALQNFQKTLPSTKCEIIELRRIQNFNLYERYNVLKEQMKKTISGDYKLERELFHGTNKAACEQINHQGFNRNFAGTHAALFGKGVYFADNANYSSRDIYSPKDENGYKYIYISQVLTGEYTEGKEDMQVPPPKDPSQNKAILYDCLVNDKESPQIFVAVKDEQAYPQYLVICKMKY